MKKKIALNTPIMIIAILSFLALVLPVTLAVYKYTVNSHGDIELAEWDVSLNQTGIENSLSIVPASTTASYTVNIRSFSQVDMSYSIVVQNLPTGVSVALDNGTPVQETNHVVTFQSVGVILHDSNTKQRSHTLTFSAASNATLVNNQTVSINVITKQII